MLKKIILILVLCFITILSESAFAKKFSCNEAWEEIIEERPIEPLYESLVGICGSDLKIKLWGKIATNKYLNYKVARTLMFTVIENDGGEVCAAYSGECFNTDKIPDHRKYNTEHSWCQSWGATGKAKSDLHHLFPVKSRLNSKRNNFPFCEVSVATWRDYGSAFGKSYSGTTCFEPRNAHKGRLARAMFYFSVRYSRPIDSEQEVFFRKWNDSYPANDREYERNERVFFHQGNRNPFIQYPEFIGLIEDF